MPKKQDQQPTGVGADSADFIKDLEKAAFCHAKPGRKPRPKSVIEVEPITSLDRAAQAEMRPNRAPHMGANHGNEDYVAAAQASTPPARPTRIDDGLTDYERWRRDNPEQAARNDRGEYRPTLIDGKRPRTEAQLANDQAMQVRARLERNHKLVSIGKSYMCSCGNTYLRAGTSRPSAESAHAPHHQIVKDILEERANNIPEAYS